jgi:tetratricopeptide (TPR) repeat protein
MDPSFCDALEAAAGQIRPDDAYPDESVFGVRGLAGGGVEHVVEVTERDGLRYGAVFGGSRDMPTASLNIAMAELSYVPFDLAEFWLGFRYVLDPIDLPPARHDTQVAESLGQRAQAARQQGDLETAYRLATEALRADGSQGALWNLRGLIRRERGDLWGAVWDYTVALERSPEEPVVLGNRGRAQYERGFLDEALADLNEALERAPGAIDPRLYRAQVLAERGDVAGAVADLEEALRRAPGHPEAATTRQVLSALRAKLGR